MPMSATVPVRIPLRVNVLLVTFFLGAFATIGQITIMACSQFLGSCEYLQAHQLLHLLKRPCCVSVRSSKYWMEILKGSPISEEIGFQRRLEPGYANGDQQW